MAAIDYKEDGVTHINCYSKANTELGRQLSNFAHTPFQHPRYGHFASVEGFWYWAASGGPTNPDKNHNQHLRRLYGASAKSAGMKCLTVPMKDYDFQSLIKEAMRCKIEQNHELREALRKSTLPLRHYFVVGRNNDIVVEKDKHFWQMEWLEELRAELAPQTVEMFLARWRGIIEDNHEYVKKNLIPREIVAEEGPIVNPEATNVLDNSIKEMYPDTIHVSVTTDMSML